MDLSFYDNYWFWFITSDYNSANITLVNMRPADRANNLTGEFKYSTEHWANSPNPSNYTFGGPSMEVSPMEPYFWIDFDDRGAGSSSLADRNDGTDWGGDISNEVCGDAYTNSNQSPMWHVWYRETEAHNDCNVNGAKNNSETDVDCGGGNCHRCEASNDCVEDNDCMSLSCVSGACQTTIYASCKEILEDHPATPSGSYEIQPDPMGSAFAVYCDMETDGGGWTAVASAQVLGDDAQAYQADIRHIHETPLSFFGGVWDGMRAVISAKSDIRFACKTSFAEDKMGVDLSFYDVDWYREMTTGNDNQSCLVDPEGPNGVARRNNLTGVSLPINDVWDNTGGGPKLEATCNDVSGFMIDFDDVGYGGTPDPTDWGRQGINVFCGDSAIVERAPFYVFVREP